MDCQSKSVFVNKNINCFKVIHFSVMWKFTVSCLTLLGYPVCSIESRYAIHGTSVLLECSIAASDAETIEWRKDSTLYAESKYINEHLPYDLRSRIFVTGSHSNGQFDLRIVNAQFSDEGEYNCSDHSYHLTFPALLISTDATYNRYILIDPEVKKLFVGQMNKLTIIDLSNDAYPVKSTYVDFPAEPDKLNYCTLSKPEIPDCQNHIRFITKKTEDTLILCGTNADSPNSYELNITDMTYTISSVPCSNDPFDNFTAIYITENPNNEELMYYASTLHGESSIQRPIPGTTDYMKGVISEKWMKEPQFVGSFDVGDRVFIFFRETAVETDPSEKKIYSRVAKVCKKDIGGNSLLRNKWTSFQKAKLDCFIPGKLPVCLDSIQDVTMRDNVFYGLFTTTTGSSASAICAFNLTSIDTVLDGPFKEQTTVNSFWTEVSTVPTPRPGKCTNESMTLSDSVLQFIADHPLMHQKVQPMYGKAIFSLDDEELQQLELDSNTKEIVFYAASNTGKVYKLFFKNENTFITSTYIPFNKSEVIGHSNIMMTRCI
ncbi:semaphorin-2A-like isoform X2 [Mytilus californianus]|uniref:semaphorin-2A-like isoform X2 n=1 Tax=Mytilus californianus TaxID=6549 RepID=UPI002246D506|nr:semaphorin-2A-like isoform X2 [Mytilus californianus]